MKDRSEVIFGNRINAKAYKKALRSKKKYYKNLEMTVMLIMRL